MMLVLTGIYINKKNNAFLAQYNRWNFNCK